jgi:glycosyltransferase involved in cell wall biosynthesis
MNVLFVHQNFPGQFRYSAAALATDKRNRVMALGINPPGFPMPGVAYGRYPIKRAPSQGVSPLLQDFQTKVIRGEAAAGGAAEMRKNGFFPDVVVVHPGWGEHMFLKDVWPKARMLAFMEFFYHTEGRDTDFDPEFRKGDLASRMRTRAKNVNHLSALDAADWCYSPTAWQRSSLPQMHQERTSVIFDGIDTEFIRPDPAAVFTLPDGRSVRSGDEVLTFVNRNLEPYRGFHVFMRALPAIQKARPEAITLIVGGDEVSYGSRPPGGGSWKDVMLKEVGDTLDLSRIAFLGRIPYGDYRTLLQVSRAHAYLTYPFVLSWSMLESMAAECLVVGSDTPPVREVLTHGETGLVIDFFDIDGWSRGLIDALARPAAFAHLRKAAREAVLARYDLRSICLPRQLKLITGLAAGRAEAVLKAI